MKTIIAIFCSFARVFIEMHLTKLKSVNLTYLCYDLNFGDLFECLNVFKSRQLHIFGYPICYKSSSLYQSQQAFTS